jgi:hypothetical protein
MNKGSMCVRVCVWRRLKGGWSHNRPSILTSGMRKVRRIHPPAFASPRRQRPYSIMTTSRLRWCRCTDVAATSDQVSLRP